MNSPLDEDPGKFYGDHLGTVGMRMVSDLDDNDFDAVVISAGEYPQYHRDDIGSAFRPNAAFARVVSGLDMERLNADASSGARLTYSPGHFVLMDTSSDKPRLFVNSDPKSPWYLPAQVPALAEEHFQVHVGTREKLFKELKVFLRGRKVAHIGQKLPKKGSPRLIHEPQAFARAMERSGLAKTPFEVAAIHRANRSSADGHRAALRNFLKGGSEGSIMAEFLRNAGQREAYLSYPPVVAIGSHGAALHYESADPDFNNGNSLLLDAGTTDLWYPADITTTYVKTTAHPVFIGLVRGLDKIQKMLVEMLNEVNDFGDLQRAMHIALGQLLLDTGLLKDCSATEAAENNYTHAFCPHSVGHSLGIQTHDKGQLEFDDEGKRVLYGDDDGPILKGGTKRHPFGKDQVVTVEPGIYFIKPLLDKFRDDPHFNWELIDQLEGGIRIETNVWLTAEGTRGGVDRVVDLTRLALTEGTNA